MILKKCGKKIVDIDYYKDETVEVDSNYSDRSPECIEEIKNGAKFFWSDKYHSDYEKYFEVQGNVRRYFMDRGRYLWIKKD